MSRQTNFKRFVKIFSRHYQMSNLSDGSVVIAFYFLLSIFPTLIILGSLFNIFKFDANQLLQNNHLFLPSSIKDTLQPILMSTLKGSSNGQLSFGIVTALWSASRAMAAFQRTVNAAYGVTKKPNAIINRITSFFWLLLGMLLFVAAMAVFTLGHFVVDFILHNLSIDRNVVLTFQSLSWIISVAVLFILCNLLFYFVPTIKTNFRYTWQGSLLAMVGVVLLSQSFSIYIKYFMRSVGAYQTLSAFVILMFWLYFLGMILLFSAVFNASLQEYFTGTIPQNNIDGAISRHLHKPKKHR